MLDKILDIIMTILPFFGGRKKRQQMAQEVKEFSELVKEQYGFLMAQLEKVLKDYFDLSDRVKEMHAEIFSLKGRCRKRWHCSASTRSVSNAKTVRTHEDNQSNCRPLLRHPGGQELHRA